VGYLPRKSEAPEEVAQVVGQDEQGQPHLVGDEARTGEARPGKSVFTLLDPLLAISPLVVETHEAFAELSQQESNDISSSALLGINVVFQSETYAKLAMSLPNGKDGQISLHLESGKWKIDLLGIPVIRYFEV